MTEEEARQIAEQLRKPNGEQAVSTGVWMNKGNHNMNLSVMKAINAQLGDSILEVGMGNGFFVGQLLDKYPGIHYTGCDFSEIMVREAIANNQDTTNQGVTQFCFGDIVALPFPTATFDTVFTVNTIYFWDNTALALQELKRVIKPGSTLLLALRPERQMQLYPFTRYGFTMYSNEAVRELLAVNGFTDINVQEVKEPDFEVNGTILKVEHMIVTATHTGPGPTE